jgi:hypothetical protein
MSVIFDAMLIPQLPEREAIDALNKALYFKDTDRHQQFGKLNTDQAGGSKAFCTDVYAAAFNHLIPDEVEDCICAAPWQAPAWVLYVRDLGDYHYNEDTSLIAVTVEALRAERAASSRTQQTETK